MAEEFDSMVSTPVEVLLESTGSKFTLVTLGALRARQINAYFGQLGDGLGRAIPPQITSVARKPLSIAFEEIAAGKIEATDKPPEPDPDDIPDNSDLVLPSPTDGSTPPEL